MPYEQKNNPFKKLVSNIKSGLNIKAPNVKKEMDWKHGLGEFASKETRRKPGESKFQYDVRMRKEARRAKGAMHDPDSDKLPTGVDATPYGDIPEEQQIVSTNTNDLRPTGESFVPEEFKGEAGDKFRYRRTGEYTEIVDGEPATYDEFEFMDPNRPELGWIPAGQNVGQGVNWQGFNAINQLYKKRKTQGKLFDSPVE